VVSKRCLITPWHSGQDDGAAAFNVMGMVASLSRAG
jgi:hypothetical protein